VTTPTTQARIRLLLPLLGILAATVLGYARVLDGALQYDDTIGIERNPEVKDLANFGPGRFLASYFSAGRPVTNLTFALNYATGRLKPWNFHLTNLLLHLGVVLLAWAFTRKVLGLAGAARTEGTALVVAGLFALHPLQSQAVSYISQRAEVMGSGFYLAALLLVLAAERRGPGRRALPLWTAAFAAFALGLGAKAIVVTMPVAWLLLVLVAPGPAGRARLLPWRYRLRAFVPFAAFAALFAIRSVTSLVPESNAGFAVPSVGGGSYALTQLRVVATYLRLLFWPAGQNLDWDYPMSRSLGEPAVLGAGFLLAGLAAGAVVLVVSARRQEGPDGAASRVSGFGVLWFFLVLSVTSSFVPLADVIMEHRVYLAAWGIIVAVAVGVERATARFPGYLAASVAVGAAGAAALALGVALHARNAVWETRRALWSDVAAKAPGKAGAYLSLGAALQDEGLTEEAVATYRRGLDLTGDDGAMRIQLLRNLGAGLIWARRYGEALDVLHEARRLSPMEPSLLVNLSVAYLAMRDTRAAEAYAKEALKISPNDGGAWNTYGRGRLAQGDLDGAEQAFIRSIQADPDVGVRFYNLGWTRCEMGKLEQGCKDFRKALTLRLDPALRKGVIDAIQARDCPR
jgi:tetratricopeptide (TPR) repeat protein